MIERVSPQVICGPRGKAAQRFAGSFVAQNILLRCLSNPSPGGDRFKPASHEDGGITGPQRAPRDQMWGLVVSG